MIFEILDNLNKPKNLFICCGGKHAEVIKEILLQFNPKLTFSYSPVDNTSNDLFDKIKNPKWGIRKEKLKFADEVMEYIKNKEWATPINLIDFWEKFKKN